MHRKRPLDEQPTWSRHVLQKIAESDRDEWQSRRERVQDNADRTLVTELLRPEPQRLPDWMPPVNRNNPHHLSLRVTGSQLPANSLLRMNQLRTTGSRTTSRSLRSTYTPVYDRLYAHSGYNTERRVYECANCRTLFTPRQLATWYNPGYRSIDLTIVYPLSDRELFPTGVPLAHAPPIPDTVEPRTEIFSDTIAVPSGSVPVVFVCSERCAQEQAEYNEIRRKKLKNIQKEDQTITSMVTQFVGGYRGNHAWEADMRRFAKDAVLPNTFSGINTPDLFFANEPIPMDGVRNYHTRLPQWSYEHRPYGFPPPEGQFLVP